MKRKLSLNTFFLPALLLVLSPSCTKEMKKEAAQEKLAQDDRSEVSGGSVEKMPKTDLLKSVKQATSRFHSTTQAIQAGYQPDDHCVSAPGLGGMGYHWVNPSLVDGVFDPLKPEAILYATGPGGKMRIIGLEYIVLNMRQARPMFGSQPFDVGGAPPLGNTPHWTLHVWLYEDNPSGMFKPFNPNISCP
jgi:hypothetical protein